MKLVLQPQRILEKCIYDKPRFDCNKVKLKKFSVCDFLFLKNEERNQVKLDPEFKGPFKVVEALDGDRYTLKALNSNRTHKYAHDRLRRMPVGHVPVEVEVEIHSEPSVEKQRLSV